MNNHTRYDALISGGGMVGLTMGVALAREGMRVAVVERAPMSQQTLPAFDGRVSAIAYGSQRMLERLGVWAHMAAFAEPILDIRVSDHHSPFFLDYDHREVGDMPFGWIVENRHLRVALQRVAKTCETLTVISPESISDFSVDATNVTTTLQSGQQMEAGLLIAADGKQSPLRTKAGIGCWQRDYKQTAIVCTIAHSQPHHGLAQERFLKVGPFAILPMQANHSSLVWVEPTDRVQIYLHLPPKELAQEISERVGGYLGEIKVVGQCFAYPLQLTIAKRYTDARLALIGDAAHAIHPIAGQGVNLGFRDVAVLHELMTERFRLGLDIGGADMLAHYERWRHTDTVTMALVTDGINKLFSNAIPPLKLARGLGLWTVGKLPPLKRLFMRHAMGTLGDMPMLMRRSAEG